MSNEGGAEMASRRRTSPALGPLEDGDLLGEILLRLPLKPSSLPRVSLVCKSWRSIAIDAAFRRHFCSHHRKPPILGVFEECARELKFRPLLDPPERFSLDLSADLSAGENFSWRVLGCRHGRVLLLNPWAHVLLVFEPVSGDTRRILIPTEFVRDGFTHASAAVLCAAGDDQNHVHGDCHMSPFKVVLVGIRKQQQSAVARVYSSETGIWGDVAWTAAPGIGGPVDSQIQIIRAEDGGLGLAILSYPSFQLWDCIVDCHGVATWVMRTTVNMGKMLGQKADHTHIAGYSEDADAVRFI